MTKMNLCFLCVCVLNLLQDIHQFACRQIDAYLSQARAPKNTHHYILITLYILIQTPQHPLFIRFGCLFIFHAMYIHVGRGGGNPKNKLMSFFHHFFD